MTIDELRACCGSLPGSHEIETWGDVERIDAVPAACKMAPYVGRIGWVGADLEALDDAVLRDVSAGAWRRTAPEALMAGHDRTGS